MPRGFVRTALGTAAVLAVAAMPASAATIEVTVTNDELNADSDCSLREAVQAANTNSAVSGCPKGQANKRDTVRLLPGPGAAHELAMPVADEDLNANGDLDLRPGGGPLTITGNARGMGGPDIVAPANNRAIESVSGSSALKIQKLNLSGGDVSTSGTGDTQGGVVAMMDAPLTLRDVNVQDGTATRGGGIRVEGARLTITDSFIADNEAEIAGGGVHVTDGSRLKLNRSGVDSNDVVGEDVAGAGVYSTTERTEIVDTEVTFNSAVTIDVADGTALGGGVFSTSERLDVKRSLISSNDAQDASGGGSSSGGGIADLGQKTTIVNSTLFGNDTDGTGGALFAREGSVSHVTFANSAAGDEGDYMATLGGDGPIKLRNSIFPGALGFTDYCAGAPGDFVSKGYSVHQFDDSLCAFLDSDAEVADIGFADGTPLPNGGETFTMGIEKDSPARNLIPKRKCKVAHKEDQRDYKRPKGKKCDAGAFERGAKP